MKTAVSVPDEVFSAAERLAKRLELSRSELYSRALDEYVARHSPDQVTEAVDLVCAEVQPKPDPFLTAAARRVVEKTEW